MPVVKNGESWRRHEGPTDADAGLGSYVVKRTWVDDAPVTGQRWDGDRGADDACHVRVHQADGGAAWAGPLWVEG